MTDREWLARLELFGIKLGLDTITALVEDLGRPDRVAPVVHLAGTNGKGSVAAMMSLALVAAGYRSGRYTSPHLVHLEERFAIDDRSAPPEALDRALSRVRASVERLTRAGALSIEPTYFEVTTAAAFEIFREAAVEVSVIEVGLGGRFDATNVVAPRVTAITSIDFDHQEQLGTTLTSIATEKAGIIKPGAPVIVGPLAPPAAKVIDAAAAAAGVAISRADRDARFSIAGEHDGRVELAIETARRRYGPLTLGLRGAHQSANAVVAVLALETLGECGIDVPPDAIEAGLRDARWPGRLDLVRVGDRQVLVDGAHNPAGARVLASYLSSAYPSGLPLVFGVMADKQADEMLRPLLPLGRPLVLTRAPGRRAAEPESLAKLVARLSASPSIASATTHDLLIERDVGQALETAWSHGATIAVAGSLYLAGEVFRRLGVRIP
jgi:dihydrofolate synthase / folylpolyglutamate synthase